MSLFGLNPGDLSIHLDTPESSIPEVELKNSKGHLVKYPVFMPGHSISGKVVLNLNSARLEHGGIKVELVGCTEPHYDAKQSRQFIVLVHELRSAGTIERSTTFDFCFEEPELPHESYRGLNIQLRYYVRATVSRRLFDMTAEKEVWVQRFTPRPALNNNIKMEVGIEGCLHIDFEYSQSKYSLSDVIIGKISFLLVRIKIQRMELSIVRRETLSPAYHSTCESEIIAKFEIMDGSPVRNETIPVRLFLNSYRLTPTYHDTDKQFSVRYFLNLVLLDQEERRYFKQQEITLWRSLPQDAVVPEATRLAATNHYLAPSGSS